MKGFLFFTIIITIVMAVFLTVGIPPDMIIKIFLLSWISGFLALFCSLLADELC